MSQLTSSSSSSPHISSSSSPSTSSSSGGRCGLSQEKLDAHPGSLTPDFKCKQPCPDNTICNDPYSKHTTSTASAPLFLNQEMVDHAVLAAMQKVQSQAVSMSKLSHGTAAKVLKAIGLDGVEAVPPAELVSAAERASCPFIYSPFTWPNNDEEKDTSAAVAHSQQQLLALGVKINQNGGFKVIDVHRQKGLLSVEIASIALNGGTDAIVIPYRTSEDWPQMQLRVLFEFKLPAAMSTLNAQGVGELLGACDWSNHPVLVVVTDLQSVFHLYWVDQLKKDGPSRMAQAKNVPPNDAWLFIRHWLVDVSSPDALYTVEQDKRRGYTALIPRGFDAFKLDLKRAKTPAGTPMGDSDESPLIDQLSVIDLLPQEERFSAAYEIIHSHYPQQLSYFS